MVRKNGSSAKRAPSSPGPSSDLPEKARQPDRAAKSPRVTPPRQVQPDEILRLNREAEARIAELTDQVMRLIHKLRQQAREHRRLEKQNKVRSAVLRLFMEASCLEEYAERTGKLLRTSLGCRCLGIRVRDEKGNIPYLWQEGFSPEFLSRENNLSLETDVCACIRIISGKIEPQDKPMMTRGGSFCCNDLPSFLDNLTPNLTSRYRGTCARVGFVTLGIVPVRYRGRPLGSLQIADEKKGALPPVKFQLAESLAPVIGEAIYRFSMERELRKSEAILARAQQIAHLGNWECELESGSVRWSDEVYRIYGLAPQQAAPPYQQFLKLVHPDDRKLVEDTIEQSVRQATAFEMDHRIVLPDGSVRFVRENGEISFGEGGRPTRMLGTVYDITETKKAEEQLRALSRRLVEIQEEERRVIARDLHDQIGQSITLLSISIERALRSPSDKASAILGETKTLVKEVMEQVREMSLNLRPSILDDLGLLAALDWHVQRYTARSAIKVTFEHSGLEVELPWDIRTVAYRIVQEALNNVARYACVSEVALRALVTDQKLTIEVEDHGIGFDPSKMALMSTGIQGMQERVALLGGELVVDSAPGAGTMVSARLPLGVRNAPPDSA